MKIIEKISLALFSIIALLLAFLSILMIFGFLEVELVSAGMVYALNTPVISNIILVFAIICILLAIKCIFFGAGSGNKDGLKDGILLENESGRLLISKDTIENLTSGVVKGFEGTENIISKVMLDKENNVKINITMFVHPDAVIKDLSNNLQTKVKDAIKKSLDLDVKEINIKIKNIAQAKATIEE